jgi:hypothetical protein
VDLYSLYLDKPSGPRENRTHEIVLQIGLKESGSFKSSHFPHTLPGYYERDIATFVEGLMSVADTRPVGSKSGTTMLTFSQAIQRIKLSLAPSESAHS